jgi:nucleoside-diphosphate-sugar epimerase
MAKAPVFPVPGNGRFVRQPLYVVDFCRIIAACIDRQPENEVYDIVGCEQIDYIDMIREIRRVTALRTPIVHIPIPIFRALLRLCALFSEEPPFTADQLEAITVGDLFVGQDIRQLFGVVPTPFRRGIQETFSKESKQS